MSSLTSEDTGTRLSRRAWAWRLAAAAAVAGCCSVGITSTAAAGGEAVTRVSIKAEGTDIYGFVGSSDPGTCAEDRVVHVFKVTRDGNRRIGSDNASLNGGRYQWNIGNPGMTGRFFARAPRIAGCQEDRSVTIRVQR